MAPWQGGGQMIGRVTFAKIIFQGPQNRFQAGTPNIAGAIAIAAINWMESIRKSALFGREKKLLSKFEIAFNQLDLVKIYGCS
jgi:cysteine desulfurase / selenocysteine lyase